MRAAVVEELTGPDAVRVRDFPEPEGPHPMADGQRVLVEVHAASVSFADLLQSRGCYQIATDPPYVSGGEFAGVVVEADPETGFAPGETVLVQGAAGGVGTAAIEVLKDLGARCIAVVSSDEKERVAREVGADEAVRSTGPWLEQVRELTDGHGVEVVLDPVGGDRFTDSLRALRIGGRLVVVGFAGGEIPSVKVNRLLLRNLTLMGISMDVMEEEFPGTVATINAAVQELLDDGTINPVIGAPVGLAEGAQALRIMERRQALGKIVLDVAPADR
jgi:NADPH2:quinone reductase